MDATEQYPRHGYHHGVKIAFTVVCTDTVLHRLALPHQSPTVAR